MTLDLLASLVAFATTVVLWVVLPTRVRSSK